VYTTHCPSYLTLLLLCRLPLCCAAGKIWRQKIIQDDPVTQSNTRGMVSFATSGKNTRTTQMFINFGNNVRCFVF
jgi:hypothetical protein